jgi:hypothetical protein
MKWFMREILYAILCIPVCIAGNISYSQVAGSAAAECARNIVSLELGLPCVGYIDWNLRYTRMIDSNYAAMAGFSLLGNIDEGSHNTGMKSCTTFMLYFQSVYVHIPILVMNGI